MQAPKNSRFAFVSLNPQKNPATPLIHKWLRKSCSRDAARRVLPSSGRRHRYIANAFHVAPSVTPPLFHFQFPSFLLYPRLSFTSPKWLLPGTCAVFCARVSVSPDIVVTAVLLGTLYGGHRTEFILEIDMIINLRSRRECVNLATRKLPRTTPNTLHDDSSEGHCQRTVISASATGMMTCTWLSSRFRFFGLGPIGFDWLMALHKMGCSPAVHRRVKSTVSEEYTR